MLFRATDIYHLMRFLSDASCTEFDVCFLVFKKNEPIRN